MTVNREECIIGANFSYVRKYHVKEEVIYFLNEIKLFSTFKSESWNAVIKFREKLIFFILSSGNFWSYLMRVI
jgi:hypothetical protein